MLKTSMNAKWRFSVFLARWFNISLNHCNQILCADNTVCSVVRDWVVVHSNVEKCPVEQDRIQASSTHLRTILSALSPYPVKYEYGGGDYVSGRNSGGRIKILVKNIWCLIFVQICRNQIQRKYTHLLSVTILILLLLNSIYKKDIAMCIILEIQ